MNVDFGAQTAVLQITLGAVFLVALPRCAARRPRTMQVPLLTIMAPAGAMRGICYFLFHVRHPLLYKCTELGFVVIGGGSAYFMLALLAPSGSAKQP